MSDLEKINNHIDHYRWGELATILEKKHGCIGSFGGRYMMNSTDSLDSDLIVFNKVCWKIFQVCCEGQFEKTLNADTGQVLQELKRIYNETSSSLHKINSCTDFTKILSTWAYDTSDRFPDGLTSIQRLEMCALFDLEKEQ